MLTIISKCKGSPNSSSFAISIFSSKLSMVIPQYIQIYKTKVVSPTGYTSLGPSLSTRRQSLPSNAQIPISYTVVAARADSFKAPTLTHLTSYNNVWKMRTHHCPNYVKNHINLGHFKVRTLAGDRSSDDKCQRSTAVWSQGLQSPAGAGRVYSPGSCSPRRKTLAGISLNLYTYFDRLGFVRPYTGR